MAYLICALERNGKNATLRCLNVAFHQLIYVIVSVHMHLSLQQLHWHYISPYWNSMEAKFQSHRHVTQSEACVFCGSVFVFFPTSAVVFEILTLVN